MQIEQFEFPAHLDGASFSSLVKHMYGCGFSKKHYERKSPGGWDLKEIKPQGNEDAICGVVPRTIANVINGNTYTRSTAHKIISFFLAGLIKNNPLYEQWIRALNEAVDRELDEKRRARTKSKSSPVSPKGDEATVRTRVFPSWYECLDETIHPVARSIQKHVSAARDRIFLIKCSDPKEYDQFLEPLVDAVLNRRCEVHWVYQAFSDWSLFPPNADWVSDYRAVHPDQDRYINDEIAKFDPFNPLHLQRITLGSSLQLEKSIEMPTKIRAPHIQNIIQKRDHIDAQRSTTERNIGHFELYESRAFHYYSGLLSIDRRSNIEPEFDQLPNRANTDDVFGFVRPFIPLAQPYTAGPALFFPSTDEIAKQYAQSTLDFLSKGRGHFALNLDGETPSAKPVEWIRKQNNKFTASRPVYNGD